MYKDKRVLAIIPARGNSKGILDKNLKTVGGKSLIDRTIYQAKQTKYIDEIVFDSDSDKLISEAKKSTSISLLKRPDELATDQASIIDVILNILQKYHGYDYIVLLQVTSPLRISSDIDNCIQQCIDEDVDSCVSVCKASKSPYWMFDENNGLLKPLFGEKYFRKRRQDLPDSYILNGAVYVAKIKNFIKERTFIKNNKTKMYVMPEARSIDIDTEIDLDLANNFLEKGMVGE